MRSNVSTRQLEAFINLAEQRSFTRAASLSHLSQPAFSALIRSLETAVGARLFDRTTRSVELTAEGAVFVDPARRLLVDAARAFGDMREHAARRRGRVSVAVLPSLAAGWLPAVLARFHAKYPGIELDVADVLSDTCIQRVRSGSADFALASTRADSAELQLTGAKTNAVTRIVSHLECDVCIERARRALVLLQPERDQSNRQCSRHGCGSLRRFNDAAAV